MLKPDLTTINRVMRRALEKMQQDGLVKPQPGQPLDLPHVFSFRPQEVEGIYTEKAGEGPGIWFRLKDGRVFNMRGQPADSNPASYGETGA